MEKENTVEEVQKIETWALVELMGHSKVVGRVSDSSWADVRVDVLDTKGNFDRTEHIGKSAIYRITEISKDVAFTLALQHAPEPSFAWSLNRQLIIGSSDDDDEDF